MESTNKSGAADGAEMRGRDSSSLPSTLALTPSAVPHFGGWAMKLMLVSDRGDGTERPADECRLITAYCVAHRLAAYAALASPVRADLYLAWAREEAGEIEHARADNGWPKNWPEEATHAARD